MQIINRKAADKCIFLDMGHGGIDKNGKYTTAPSKEYFHRGEEFHNGGWFYEGVKNRDFGLLMWEKMIKKNIHVVPICHPSIDTPLSDRTNIANTYHRTIQKGVLISEHSNAITGPGNLTNTTARGMSVWTAPGQSESDILAEEFIKMFKTEFAGPVCHERVNILEQTNDGDGDYEAKFHMLVMSVMPAVLFETLFFDHLSDARILFDDCFINSYTDLMAEWAEWVVKR